MNARTRSLTSKEAEAMQAFEAVLRDELAALNGRFVSRMREFVGYLSAAIPELHSVEVPRLAEALDRFLALEADEVSPAVSRPT